MKSLTSPSSSLTAKILHFCLSSCVRFHPTNHQVVCFPLTKLPSLHFISFLPIHLLPFRSSSLSPDSQTDLELAETLNHESYESKTVHVKFQLQKECSFGEQFAIVGDDPNLGLWDPENAIPLNWSDDHVWNLELDLPIGKSIHFKFILKQISGSILWQPGPDRILKTWDTMNTIVVCQDWEDASSQKLLEEELISSQNVDPSVNEEILVNVESNLPKELFPSEENIISNSNEEAVAFEKILQDSGRTAEEANLGSVNFGEDVMIEEGDAVLVPGLPLEPVNYDKIEASDECDKGTTSAIDASAGVHELEEKHNVNANRNESEMIEKFSEKEEQPQDELDGNEENRKTSNKVFENDIQWGRKTIQRLLTSLGLL